MDGQNTSLPMKDAIYLTFVGYFFNNFMPTAIGGDIVKAYYTSKKTNNKFVSYAAVLSDRLFGVMATLFIAIIGVIFVGKNLGNITIIYAIFFIFALSTLLLYFLLIKKSKGMPIYKENSNISVIGKLKINISRLYNVINLYRDKPSLLIKVILLSLFLQALAIVSIYFFILCLGGKIYLLKLFLIVPIIWTLSMLPSLNGLGVREGAFAYFLKSDIGAEMSFTTSLLWLGMTIIYSIIGGIMHLCYPIKVEVTNDR
jgi:uncharacterized protein (TIRG00374 family)